jgi:hypothetical protein
MMNGNAEDKEMGSMGRNRSPLREQEDQKPYAPTPVGAHILTPEQVIAFERRQAEPPHQPTEEAREAVRMFQATVKR